MMKDLVLLTNPQTVHVPRLLPTAILDCQELIGACEEHMTSLQQYQNRTSISNIRTSLQNPTSTHIPCRRSSKYQAQVEWSAQAWPDSCGRIKNLFGLNDVHDCDSDEQKRTGQAHLDTPCPMMNTPHPEADTPHPRKTSLTSQKEPEKPPCEPPPLR